MRANQAAVDTSISSILPSMDVAESLAHDVYDGTNAYNRAVGFLGKCVMDEKQVRKSLAGRFNAAITPTLVRATTMAFVGSAFDPLDPWKPLVTMTVNTVLVSGLSYRTAVGRVDSQTPAQNVDQYVKKGESIGSTDRFTTIINGLNHLGIGFDPTDGSLRSIRGPVIHPVDVLRDFKIRDANDKRLLQALMTEARLGSPALRERGQGVDGNIAARIAEIAAVFSCNAFLTDPESFAEVLNTSKKETDDIIGKIKATEGKKAVVFGAAKALGAQAFAYAVTSLPILHALFPTSDFRNLIDGFVKSHGNLSPDVLGWLKSAKTPDEIADLAKSLGVNSAIKSAFPNFINEGVLSIQSHGVQQLVVPNPFDPLGTMNQVLEKVGLSQDAAKLVQVSSQHFRTQAGALLQSLYQQGPETHTKFTMAVASAAKQFGVSPEVLLCRMVDGNVTNPLDVLANPGILRQFINGTGKFASPDADLANFCRIFEVVPTIRSQAELTDLNARIADQMQGVAAGVAQSLSPELQELATRMSARVAQNEAQARFWSSRGRYMIGAVIYMISDFMPTSLRGRTVRAPVNFASRRYHDPIPEPAPRDDQNQPRGGVPPSGRGGRTRQQASANQSQNTSQGTTPPPGGQQQSQDSQPNDAGDPNAGPNRTGGQQASQDSQQGHDQGPQADQDRQQNQSRTNTGWTSGFGAGWGSPNDGGYGYSHGAGYQGPFAGDAGTAGSTASATNESRRSYTTQEVMPDENTDRDGLIAWVKSVGNDPDFDIKWRTIISALATGYYDGGFYIDLRLALKAAIEQDLGSKGSDTAEFRNLSRMAQQVNDELFRDNPGIRAKAEAAKQKRKEERKAANGGSTGTRPAPASDLNDDNLGTAAGSNNVTGDEASTGSATEGESEPEVEETTDQQGISPEEEARIYSQKYQDEIAGNASFTEVELERLRELDPHMYRNIIRLRNRRAKDSQRQTTTSSNENTAQGANQPNTEDTGPSGEEATEEMPSDDTDVDGSEDQETDNTGNDTAGAAPYDGNGHQENPSDVTTE